MGRRLAALLDRAADGWRRWAGRGRWAPVWEFLQAVRPAWWVARAWLAMQLVWLVKNDGDAVLLPFYSRHPVTALALMAGATVVSVQLGRGRWWPRSDARARLVMVGLNATATVMVPITMAHLPDPDQAWWDLQDLQGYYSNGVFNDGSMVCNIRPFNAQGQPLEGVQLFDGQGRPLTSACAGDGVDRLRWRSDGREVGNVYPMLDPATGRAADLQPGSVPVVEDPSDSE